MMQVKILNNKIKAFYKTINASIMLFAILWSIIFILLLFKNSLIKEINSYLMAISILPLIIGLISFITYAFINKPFLKIDDSKEIVLILNMREVDFTMHQLRMVNDSGNFLKDPVSNSLHEISSDQVKELLSLDRAIPFILEFKVQKSEGLGDISPKAFFKDTIQGLWAAS